MKSLSSSLGARLFIGCVCTVAVLLGIQTAGHYQETLRRVHEDVELAVQSAIFEVGRQRQDVLLEARLAARIAETTPAQSATPAGPEGPLPLTLDFEGAGSARVVAGTPPANLPELVEAIRSASVAGVSGADAPSSAVILVGGVPLVVGAAGGRHGVGGGHRRVLIRPLDLGLAQSRYAAVEYEFHDLQTDPPSSPYSGALADLEGPDGAVSIAGAGGALEMRAFRDGASRPALVVSTSQDYSFNDAFVSVLKGHAPAYLLIVTVSVLIAMQFLRRSVVRPLAEFQRRVARLKTSGKARSSLQSGDVGEFRELGRALDLMMSKVQIDRHEIVRDARRAGMSDVSMGVVHAAGNILNSINVSTKLLRSDVEGMDMSDMHSLARELEEHSHDLATYISENDHGKFLVPFIIAMADSVGELHSRCVVELESVDLGLKQAIDLIRSQEKYAVGPAMVVEVELSDIVERALEIACMSVDQVDRIDIDRQYDGIPLLRTDPHRLTSALISIIVNALEALEGDELVDRRLSLRVYGTEDRRVVVEVTDSGAGIAPEALDLIFTSSFTNKHGHAGEGLHMAANVCQELGIAIGVMSEGLGTGCSIKLRIPTGTPQDGASSSPGKAEIQVAAPRG